MWLRGNGKCFTGHCCTISKTWLQPTATVYFAQRDMSVITVTASSWCDVPPRGAQCLVLSVSHCAVRMRRIRKKSCSFERWRSADTALKGRRCSARSSPFGCVRGAHKTYPGWLNPVRFEHNVNTEFVKIIRTVCILLHIFDWSLFVKVVSLFVPLLSFTVHVQLVFLWKVTKVTLQCCVLWYNNFSIYPLNCFGHISMVNICFFPLQNAYRVI